MVFPLAMLSANAFLATQVGQSGGSSIASRLRGDGHLPTTQPWLFQLSDVSNVLGILTMTL
jgi:hypothetical protein